MLPTTLNTNEIKDATGTEIEFSRLSSTDRKLIFVSEDEAPNLPHRLTVQHQEIGAGLDRRRRSNVSFSKSLAGGSGTTRNIVVSTTVDIPVGDISAYTEVTAVMAELMSFLASRGASTTILYDGTGYGAESLINGSL